MKRLFPQGKLIALIILATGLSANAFSQSSDSKYNLAGFASFVYAKAIDDDPAVDSVTSESFSGLNDGMFTEDGEYRDFNKLGLRLDVDLGNKLSFATQAVMRGENDYDPDFDWIYLSYDINPNLKLSVGKTTIPLYMYSDYLDTSYAYQWIEPPHSVYGSGTVKSTEGLRLSWRASMGGLWSSYLTVWTGKTDEGLPELSGANVSVDNGLGAAWEVERDWLTLRAVYFTGTTSLDEASNMGLAASILAPIDESINPDGNPNNLTSATLNSELYQNLIWEDEDSQFIGFGIGLDFEHVFFSTEATQVHIDGNNLPTNKVNSWYAMIGTRLPAGWSISFTYAGDDEKVNKDIAQSATAEFGPGAGGQVEKAVYSQHYYENTSYTLGSRWNFHPQASLKMEYLTSTTEKGFADERNPKGFRLGVDLVF